MSRPTTPRAQPAALRIELLDVEPLIWRRIVVSDQWTLASLLNRLNRDWRGKKSRRG